MSLPIRTLPDDTLLVVLSDCHIGGSDDRDIFESPNDLLRLFDELGAHPGPVELVLAGDFFDFLRIARVPDGINRAAATISRPEYAALFTGLRRFAAAAGGTSSTCPATTTPRMWWNPEIRAELKTAGLVHEFVLSYAACFQSAPERLVYCEHGNEFDPDNAIIDYADPPRHARSAITSSPRSSLCCPAAGWPTRCN